MISVLKALKLCILRCNYEKNKNRIISNYGDILLIIWDIVHYIHSYNALQTYSSSYDQFRGQCH